jgi:hypothetical protein
VALRKPVERGLARRIFGATPEASLALLRSVWAQAVGPDLAQRTEVLALEGRALRIRVPDARWRKVLHRMQRDILLRMYEQVGDMAPKYLGFQEGAVSAPPQSSPQARRVVVPAALPASLAAVAASIPDAEIRGRFEASAALYLSRFLGEP